MRANEAKGCTVLAQAMQPDHCAIEGWSRGAGVLAGWHNDGL